MANSYQTRYPVLTPDLYFYAENQRRYGLDRFDYGGIHRIEGRYRLPYRLRRSGIQTRPRYELCIYPLRTCRHYVRFGSSFRKACH